MFLVFPVSYSSSSSSFSPSFPYFSSFLLLLFLIFLPSFTRLFFLLFQFLSLPVLSSLLLHLDCLSFLFTFLFFQLLSLPSLLSFASFPRSQHSYLIFSHIFPNNLAKRIPLMTFCPPSLFLSSSSSSIHLLTRN